MSSYPYDSVYGVSLLDDLHNYFPALLYDSSSFASVQEVLAYLQTETRERFDLFSREHRSYRSRAPSVPAPAAPVARAAVARAAVARAAATRVPQSYVLNVGDSAGTYYNLLPSLRSTSTLPSRSVTAEVIEEDDMTGIQEAEMNTLTSRLLLQLLALPPGSLTTRPATVNSFLTPVIVRPTEQQINQNTMVGSIVSDTIQMCAICQDTLTPEQEARRLNVCDHWFHRGCIDPWFQRNVHCPVCRHDVRDSTPLSNNRNNNNRNRNRNSITSESESE